MSKKQEELEKRTQKALLTESIVRWESAVVIALTIILMAFGNMLTGVPAWAWLLGGTLSEALLVYSSLTDPEFGNRVVAELLKTEFQPQQLRDKALQSQILKAFDYRARIAAALRDRGDSVVKDTFLETSSQIDEWIEAIFNLAKRLDRYRMEQSVLMRDRDLADKRITQLQKKLANETDASLISQIEDTMAGMKQQIQTIDSLTNTMQRAELQMENTLTHLGTVYSQSMLAGAKDIDSSRAKRLQHEISDEVAELTDVLVAMDEVYAQGG